MYPKIKKTNHTKKICSLGQVINKKNKTFLFKNLNVKKMKGILFLLINVSKMDMLINNNKSKCKDNEKYNPYMKKCVDKTDNR